MSKQNQLLVIMIACIILSIYFVRKAMEPAFVQEPTFRLPPIEKEADPLDEPLELAEPEPEEITPELEAARRDLRSLALAENEVADKLLNFILSGKKDFRREVYEFQNNPFLTQETLSPALEQELQNLAEVLKAYPRVNIELITHTNEEGTWDDQQERTGARANLLKKYLRDQGVASQQIIPSGYGASNPIADGNSERGRQMNERIELLIRGL